MKLRHQLIYLCPNLLSSSALTSIESESLREEALAWFLQGLPAVYPRQLSPGELQLALTILKNKTKYRVSFNIDSKFIDRETSLPLLEQMADCFDFNVKQVSYLNNLHVYGSFLYEFLSQQHFVTETSDLDMLIKFPGCSLVELNDLLLQLENMARRRVDGEIRFQHLGDIAIRELLDVSTDTCLAKNHHHTFLVDRNKIYEYYPQLCP